MLVEAIKINETQMKIGDEVVDFQLNSLTIGDKCSLLKQPMGGYLFLEKIDDNFIDETIIKQRLTIDLLLPTSGNITSVFGPRRNPLSGSSEFHEGVDISNDEGTDIFASEAGTVQVLENELYGKHLIIDHIEIKSIYAHLSEIFVNDNQSVVRGQLIGLMGNTGKSSGPHLHFGLRYGTKDLNPKVFFPKGTLLLGYRV